MKTTKKSLHSYTGGMGENQRGVVVDPVGTEKKDQKKETNKAGKKNVRKGQKTSSRR